MEHEETLQQLELLGKKILRAARDELYLGMRFMDVALNSLQETMTTDISPFGTDGRYFYFHPQELGGLYRQNRVLVNRGYLHSVYHCIFRHLWKAIPRTREEDILTDRELSETMGTEEGAYEVSYGKMHTDRDGEWMQRIWNLACDIAVEHLIDSNFHRSVRFSRSLIRRESYRKLEQENEIKTRRDNNSQGVIGGKTETTVSEHSADKAQKPLYAERIFKILLKWELPEKELKKLENEFYVDDHRYWSNRDPDKKPDSESVLQKRWQDLDEKIEMDLETFSKEAAEKNGDLLGLMRIENRERYNYREFLRKFAVFREELGVDVDSFDYNFYTYGLTLYGNMPLIEPQETQEVKRIDEFAVVIDTSMSCSGETVRKFLEETYSILSEAETFSRKINVHIIQCDEAVQSDVKITCMEELRGYMENLTLYGEGGTDFRPAFAYADELMHKGEYTNLKGLIYFTDGFGIYPEKMPKYQTAFVFLEEEDAAKEVPPWAIKLVLEETDLEKSSRSR